MSVAASPMERVEYFLKAYTTRDVNGVLTCYADSEFIAAIGTDRVQNYVGPKAIQEGMADDFLSFDRAEIDIVWHHVGSDDSTAWVVAACRALFALGLEEIHVALRLSAVLKKQNNNWLLLQTHFSFPS